MIRLARPADVGAIFGLIAQLARYEKLEHQVVGTEEDLRRFLFGAERYAEVLVAEADEIVAARPAGGAHDRPATAGAPDADRAAASGTPIVGFALYFHTFSTFLCKPGVYLEDLFVVPEHRRRGLGTQLLGALARIAIERGCGRLDWMVLSWNESAATFYRTLGAKCLDEWRSFRLTGEALEQLAAGGAKSPALRG